MEVRELGCSLTLPPTMNTCQRSSHFNPSRLTDDCKMPYFKYKMKEMVSFISVRTEKVSCQFRVLIHSSEDIVSYKHLDGSFLKAE